MKKLLSIAVLCAFTVCAQAYTWREVVCVHTCITSNSWDGRNQSMWPGILHMCQRNIDAGFHIGDVDMINCADVLTGLGINVIPKTLKH